jgi:hypothetical protein
MEATSWVFPPGHSIRLSVAGNDWPNTWVPPQPVTLTVESLQMQLPVLPSGGAGVPQFTTIEPPERSEHDGLTWSVHHDVLSRQTTASSKYGSTYDTRHGGTMTDHYEGSVMVPLSDPALAQAAGVVRFAIDWPEASVAVESRMLVASNAEEYSVEIELDAFESGTLIAERRWSRRIPRRLA